MRLFLVILVSIFPFASAAAQEIKIASDVFHPRLLSAAEDDVSKLDVNELRLFADGLAELSI